ncbi:uncharacterized protein TNCV_5049071 [Trichonephila clavipes]|nr:uncharacterized protein TNCV_5049071 [Trichonephila clavipes]
MGCKYTAGHRECKTKEDQRYHREIYLADNMYEDQAIKITASCDSWMRTKSVIRVAAISGYSRCHTLRHRIKETLDVSLVYGSPCGFHILSKLIWCSSGGCIPGQLLWKRGPHVFDWR